MTWLQKLLNAFKKKEVIKKEEVDMEKKYVTGIDIYHGDIITDWSKLAKEIDFIFIKCTEGDFRDDPKFKEYRQKAKEYGIICGHYHFYRSNKDPIEQTKDFIRNVVKIEVGELPPVCDWETEDDPQDGNDAGEVQVYMDEIEKKLGMIPIIYSGFYFIKDKKLAKSFSRYPIWVADYNSAPRIPSPWEKWIFWQKTDKQVVAGVKKPCDFNYFNGTKDELIKLCKK
jgi:lysozyme